MSRARVAVASAAVLLTCLAPSAARARHSSWACTGTIVASTHPTTVNCSLFLTGAPTGVKGTVTAGSGTMHVSITFDPVADVRGPAVAECTATRSAGCEHTVGVGSRVILPGIASNSVLVWCHVEAATGVGGTYECTSGYSL